MDFDKFIEEATNDAKQESDILEYISTIEKNIDEKLLEYNVPFIATFDDQRLKENFQRAYQTHLSSVIERYETTNRHLHEAEVHALADMATRVQLAREDYLLSRVCMLVTIHEQLSIEERTAGKLTTLKKEFIADVIINENIPPEHTFHLLINDIVPGESLDLASEDDSLYLIEALEKHANQEEKIKRSDTLVNATMELLDDTSLQENEKLHLLIRLTNIADTNEGTDERSVAQRESKIAEITRETNLSAAIITQLMTLIQEFHQGEQQ